MKKKKTTTKYILNRPKNNIFSKWRSCEILGVQRKQAHHHDIKQEHAPTLLSEKSHLCNSDSNSEEGTMADHVAPAIGSLHRGG